MSSLNLNCPTCNGQATSAGWPGALECGFCGLVFPVSQGVSPTPEQPATGEVFPVVNDGDSSFAVIDGKRVPILDLISN